MRELKHRAIFNVITDPERFFSNADYINDVIFGRAEEATMVPMIPDDPDSPEVAKINCLVLEDTPAVLIKQARDRQSYDVARLLNITDGLLGQGANCILLFTTNEDIDSIDGAYLRPGRCLHQLNFKTLDQDAARAWLKRQGHEADVKLQDENTLADLYAIINNTKPLIQELDKAPVGFK